MAEVHEQMARIADAVIKLTSEIERLRRDVNRLASRYSELGVVEQFDERMIRRLQGKPTRVRKLTDAFDLIAQARRDIVDCESKLNQMLSVLNSFDSAAVPRAEMERFLKNKRGDGSGDGSS